MAKTSGAAVSGGFADPVFDSQAVFASIMNAFARPGTVAELGGRADPPSPVSKAAGGFLLTLADHDTPVYLAGGETGAPLGAWLGFHAGAPLAGSADAATFAYVASAAPLPDLASFALGTDTYPDRSTTIVLECNGLEGGAMLALEGPGIETMRRIGPRGLPQGFVARWEANRRLFPRGVDLVLTCGTAALCLPRTTRIREG